VVTADDRTTDLTYTADVGRTTGMTMRPNPPWQNRIVGYGSEPPDQLLANPLNWRDHPQPQADALSGVLNDVGLVQNVIVNKRTGHLVDGHLRVKLAMREQQPDIAVTYIDVSPDEEHLILASLDPIGAMATADRDTLDQLLRTVSTDNESVMTLLADLAESAGVVGYGDTDGLTDPDEMPNPPAEPITQPGDLWLLGRHRLLCGDSTKAEDVARLMAGEKAHCLWTDPPYGVEYVGKTKDALKLQNDDADGLRGLLDESFANATKSCVDGAAFYIARPPGALSVTFGNAILDAGWRLHQELQWVKDSMVLGHSDYHIRHETVVFGYMPGGGRRGRGGDGWYGDNSQTSVFEVDRPKASPDHPTGKPVDLIVQQITNSSRSNDLTLDLFGGSGSTLIACEQTNRRCAMMEIDPTYCDVIVRRWENFTGQTAERASDAMAAD
jgi:DNA modification methylase